MIGFVSGAGCRLCDHGRVKIVLHKEKMMKKRVLAWILTTVMVIQLFGPAAAVRAEEPANVDRTFVTGKETAEKGR